MMELLVDRRQCTKCRETKPVAAFDRQSAKRGGRQSHCKACRVLYQRRKRAENPAAAAAYMRAYNLKAKYGITMAEYERLMDAQNGVCAICQRPPKTHPYRSTKRVGALACLVVDHDHATGQLRGLLCNDCNRAVGLLKDDPTVLGRALAYVTAHAQARSAMVGS